MNLYLISQTEKDGVDTIGSAVVCACSEDVARHMNPATWIAMDEADWSSIFNEWCSSPDAVTVKFLGVAHPGVHWGVICTSRNSPFWDA